MTYKSHSLFRQVFPRRGRGSIDAHGESFETYGGVYQDSKGWSNSYHNNKKVLMIIQEDDCDDREELKNQHDQDLGEKLKSLDENATLLTALTSNETLSTSGSFEDSLSGDASRCSHVSPTSFQWTRQASQRNLFANLDFNSLDDDDEDDDVAGSPSCEWKSSGDCHHHDDAPIITLRSESLRLIDPKRPELQLGDDEVLHKVLSRASKRLPRHSGEFASLHVMINSERLKHQVAPLQRLPVLDELARQHAAGMAKNQRLEHADLQGLRESLMATAMNHSIALHRVGSNVASCRDGDLVSLHSSLMKKNVADRNNILDRRYTCMGVGTYKSKEDGKLYVCQLFT